MLYVVSSDPSEASQIGFIVSKAVGNAVTRNLVKRRLREIAAATIQQQPNGILVVVRALPSAATASWSELVDDYQRAFSKAYSRLLPKSGKDEVNHQAASAHKGDDDDSEQTVS